MVATLGETTGPSALRALHARMAAHPVGLEILQTKPRCVRSVCVVRVVRVVRWCVSCVSCVSCGGVCRACRVVSCRLTRRALRITEDTLAFDRLLAMPEDTLGGAYARWMRGHEFTPDERYRADARSARPPGPLPLSVRVECHLKADGLVATQPGGAVRG